MIRGLASGYFSSRSLQDDFDVRFGHRLPQIPVDDGTAVAVQNAAQVVERPADVDVGNVDVPVLMRLQRLLEAGAFLRRLAVPSDSSPACCSTRQTLDGLTATMSASSIMNVSRR